MTCLKLRGKVSNLNLAFLCVFTYCNFWRAKDAKVGSACARPYRPYLSAHQPQPMNPGPPHQQGRGLLHRNSKEKMPLFLICSTWLNSPSQVVKKSTWCLSSSSNLNMVISTECCDVHRLPKLFALAAWNRVPKLAKILEATPLARPGSTDRREVTCRVTMA